jgi:two-component system nitrate/nitrite response regulator NarL
MDAVRDLQPSVLVVEKAFGTPALVDWMASLRALGRKVSVVVWSAAVSQSEALRLLQSGASGVVRKTAPLETVMKCLRTVVAGSNWMEEDLLREMERPQREGHSPLTSREAQVMELVERGLKNKDIAETLGICVGTVKIHLKHIFEKTGIRGRYGLAISGLKEKGLLSSATPD